MLAVNGKTKVVGLIGYPVEHTFSPSMHNAAFGSIGLNMVYLPFSIKPENLSNALDGIRGLDLIGANVTIPYKEKVISCLDKLSSEAEMIGAVNTIVNNDGILKGYNTDGLGFIRSLEEDAGVTPEDKSVMILGAGGAAKAVAFQLALSGIQELTLAVRRLDEGNKLSNDIGEKTGIKTKVIGLNDVETGGKLREIDILINATPIGMSPNVEDMPPVNLKQIPDDAIVCDLIYNPAETQLLAQAKGRGLKTLNGIGMLLYQGALAFELWTGIKPPIEIMKKALKKAITCR